MSVSPPHPTDDHLGHHRAHDTLQDPARPAAPDVAARAVAAVALAALALIHVVDLPDTWSSSVLVGSEYVGLIVASVLLAGALLTRSGGQVWAGAALVPASAMAAYVLSRTTGIPGDHGDIGNWRCSLGIAALTVETLLMLLAGGVLAASLAAHRIPVRPYPVEEPVDPRVEAAS